MMAVKSKNDGGVVAKTKKPEKGGKFSAKGVSQIWILSIKIQFIYRHPSRRDQKGQ
jgi:hypothetical protein